MSPFKHPMCPQPLYPSDMHTHISSSTIHSHVLSPIYNRLSNSKHMSL